MKKTLVALAVTALLTSCSKTVTYEVTNSSCAGFNLIKASRQDTTETLRQVLVHNNTYRQICVVGKKNEKQNE
ncbi:hypothetical protein [Pasteurella multocida]|uniref:hypothetical protein n=1 Tax=Pasteurella multocida TaxID=747 RepID=UPI000E30A76D|nr:hypothetical protein [Pasteurella multocida]AXN95980.1 hypothetical protein DYY62_09035 [Pasteurella multocida]AXN99783.1 hypothetical protein DYY61_08505 [Pasteurella multocida]AXO01992.1 hypothetical protein DYY63_08505 [Pasteurella multocida]AXO04212.1 hypothetical protein DYY64_08515 [Pasteurella multocida]QDA24787.1 hypothetical protein FHZ86_08505 [Pasteurella multocida]